MSDLQDYLWMRDQWRRFRRLLIGAVAVVWVLCASGLLFLRSEDPAQWFWSRMSFLVVFGVASAVAIWLFVVASREIRTLSEEATQARLEAAQKAREERRKRRRSPAS